KPTTISTNTGRTISPNSVTLTYRVERHAPRARSRAAARSQVLVGLAAGIVAGVRRAIGRVVLDRVALVRHRPARAELVGGRGIELAVDGLGRVAFDDALNARQRRAFVHRDQRHALRGP